MESHASGQRQCDTPGRQRHPAFGGPWRPTDRGLIGSRWLGRRIWDRAPRNAPVHRRVPLRSRWPHRGCGGAREVGRPVRAPQGPGRGRHRSRDRRAGCRWQGRSGQRPDDLVDDVMPNDVPADRMRCQHRPRRAVPDELVRCVGGRRTWACRCRHQLQAHAQAQPRPARQAFEHGAAAAHERDDGRPRTRGGQKPVGRSGAAVHRHGIASRRFMTWVR